MFTHFLDVVGDFLPCDLQDFGDVVDDALISSA